MEGFKTTRFIKSSFQHNNECDESENSIERFYMDETANSQLRKALYSNGEL